MDIFPSDILRKILKIVPHKQRLVLSGVNKQWKIAYPCYPIRFWISREQSPSTSRNFYIGTSNFKISNRLWASIECSTIHVVSIPKKLEDSAYYACRTRGVKKFGKESNPRESKHSFRIDNLHVRFRSIHLVCRLYISKTGVFICPACFEQSHSRIIS